MPRNREQDTVNNITRLPDILLPFYCDHVHARWLSLNWRRAEATRIRMRYFYCHDNDSPLRFGVLLFSSVSYMLQATRDTQPANGRRTSRMNNWTNATVCLRHLWNMERVCLANPLVCSSKFSYYHTDFYPFYLVQVPFRPVLVYLFVLSPNPPLPPGHPIPWIVIRFYKWLRIHILTQNILGYCKWGQDDW